MQEVLLLSDEVVDRLETVRRLRWQRGAGFECREYVEGVLLDELDDEIDRMYERRARPFMCAYRDKRLDELRSFFGEERLQSVVERCVGAVDGVGCSTLVELEYKRELLEGLLAVQVDSERWSGRSSLDYGVPLFTEGGELVAVVCEYECLSESSVPREHIQNGISRLVGRVLEGYIGVDPVELDTQRAFVALNTDALVVDEQSVRQYSAWEVLSKM